MQTESVWTRFGKPTIDVIQTIGIVAGGIGLFYTAAQVHDSRQVQSATFGLQFDERLSKPNLLAIVDAVEDDHPQLILSEHGGASQDDDLEALLGDYDTLYSLWEEKLINNQMIYNLFCGDIVPISKNAEISKYLRDEREKDNDLTIYDGFDKMARQCDRWDETGVGETLAK